MSIPDVCYQMRALFAFKLKEQSRHFSLLRLKVERNLPSSKYTEQRLRHNHTQLNMTSLQERRSMPTKPSMFRINSTATALLIATTSLSILLFIITSPPPPPKSSYYSLYISKSLSDNATISQHLFALTRRPHVAGSEANAEAAAYVLSTFNSYNLRSHIVSYDVSLTYPLSRTLKLTRPPPDPATTFDLRQEIYPGDPYPDVANEVLPTFHAYAKSGTAAGFAAYVNYGRVEDYVTLKEMGVNVSGAVVLARYGEIYRGDIVENAYEAGAVGVVVFTDRKDYGGGASHRWFPDDKWMPPSGVQVGTVYGGAGDPTTPGWPSTSPCERLSNNEVERRGDVPLIPSLPVSAADGDIIMRSIGGQVANDDWQGSADAPLYRVGTGPGFLNLSYTGNQIIATIQNVIGVIEGAEEPDRYALISFKNIISDYLVSFHAFHMA
uniref:PA domain-containing protein n=1 Tax=Nelumbo nucifera TaxID=4432 RepID=A0A822ZIW1_NELNU|nr:TPA_asm: hypothetical protein HUJ06_002803 [Nelumbo nucifera]